MIAATTMTADALRANLRARELVRRRLRPDPWFGAGGAARPGQCPPDGEWRTWLILAGRGWGKTATGAQWVRRRVMDGTVRRVALVGATAADVRDVMVEGISGILAACRMAGFGAQYQPSRRRVVFENGAVAMLFSAEEPDRLRGPQHELAWADEVAAWPDPDAWDQLQFGLRLGANPQQVVTTTPRPTRLVRSLVASPSTVTTRGTTYENRANLSPAFFAEIIAKYEGTRLGRAELEGELLDDVPGALWTLAQIDAHRAEPPKPDDLVRIVVGVDPSASDGGDEESAETGIVVSGRHWNGHGYVLEDASVRGTPYRWASAVVAAYDRWKADAIVAEANQGGAMVARTIQSVWEGAPVTLVHASRGKLTRAEPVASLAEQGRIHHAGTFPTLEDQLTTYDGSGASPDRLDAMVWAMTDCMVGAPPAEVDPAIVAAFGGG